MTNIIAKSGGLSWPSDKVSTVPYGLYTDQHQYLLEHEKVFKGPTWNYLCLDAELPENGTYKVSRIGETPIVVTRDPEGNLHAFVNRCAHRGALLCLKPEGKAEEITCVYHAWSYSLKGELKSVAFQRGLKRQGGMPKEFDKSQHNLRRLRVVEFSGLIFGSFSEDAPDIEDYLGPEIAQRIRRVLNRPIRILGQNVQVLNNNWKLYIENAKDSYHASILHTFFTTFEINRLNQKGGIVVDESGGNHVSYSKIDSTLSNEDYTKQNVRSSKDDYRLADPSLLDSVDEYGDGVTLQILTVFPGLVLQQIQNAIAVRQIVPTGVQTTELGWTYIGFEDDDEAMVERRLKQANLAGPAGFISMEDGAVGNFVQRAIEGTSEDESVVLMGGETAESQPFRVTETSVRGFWKKYRTLIEGKVPNA
ncbi:aromatic ring-hydroxylating dioxygenase subunit alpha [Marinobacter sp. UBA2678]|jgi:terephthalate 1,2-dioxygenase oxygenase component alpha subunit|uniref:aromatic ring-hydroxylating dioxygenase subunit alpha n=1 Tax=Marinobacter sp. UBA2678 TaxID=1946815 RepID=UPI000C0A6F0E|nr:aromatic ring-hydroxylating dioxygenase subunit alpha [Marinobacter sp. UBA2678]MAM86674.1 Rieske (2Fe-2S) protein [Hahellaceae bacterium]|tara:strand:+ start:1899 stop:3158 length:1260 start_codon:yes stop_codon:yes gene_type:complete